MIFTSVHFPVTLMRLSAGAKGPPDKTTFAEVEDELKRTLALKSHKIFRGPFEGLETQNQRVVLTLLEILERVGAPGFVDP